MSVSISTVSCGSAQKSARACERVQLTAHVQLRFGNRVRSGKVRAELYSLRLSESFLGTYLSPHTRSLLAPTLWSTGTRAYSSKFCIAQARTTEGVCASTRVNV